MQALPVGIKKKIHTAKKVFLFFFFTKKVVFPGVRYIPQGLSYTGTHLLFLFICCEICFVVLQRTEMERPQKMTKVSILQIHFSRRHY